LYARVQVEVTALKAMLEAASGVPASRQRLICRGRVLKDTQRLSELRVEDGDTLHMVRE
jgi:ubiquilin